MSLVERRRRRSSGGAPVPGGKPAFLRLVAAGTAGLCLMGSAYYATFVGAQPLGIAGDYRGPGDDDDDGGIDTGTGIAIGAGALGLLFLAGAFRRGAPPVDTFPIGAAHDCRERYETLPADRTRITELRLVPEQSTLSRGRCRCVHLEARSEGRWYSVTHRAESTIEEQDPDPCIQKQDGTKNVFCVPMDVSQTCNGRSVVLVGTFSPAGQSPMSATARITVRVPNER